MKYQLQAREDFTFGTLDQIKDACENNRADSLPRIHHRAIYPITSIKPNKTYGYFDIEFEAERGIPAKLTVNRAGCAWTGFGVIARIIGEPLLSSLITSQCEWCGAEDITTTKEGCYGSYIHHICQVCHHEWDTTEPKVED